MKGSQSGGGGPPLAWKAHGRRDRLQVGGNCWYSVLFCDVISGKGQAGIDQQIGPFCCLVGNAKQILQKNLVPASQPAQEYQRVIFKVGDRLLHQDLAGIELDRVEIQIVLVDESFEDLVGEHADAVPGLFQPFTKRNIGLDVSPRAERVDRDMHLRY